MVYRPCAAEWWYTDLLALRLSSPQEGIEQIHLNIDPAKENKNKRDYLRRAITIGTTPLSDEELIDFLELMRNATFGVVTVRNNTSEDNSSHDSLSYFV